MTFLSCTYCPVVAFPLVLSRRVPVGYGSVAVNEIALCLHGKLVAVDGLACA